MSTDQIEKIYIDTLSQLSLPTRRALERIGVTTAKDFARISKERLTRRRCVNRGEILRAKARFLYKCKHCKKKNKPDAPKARANLDAPKARANLFKELPSETAKPTVDDDEFVDRKNPCQQMLSSVNVDKEYSSLLARIFSIYGIITIKQFLEIRIDEFAEKRGVGHLYVKRLAKLQQKIREKVHIDKEMYHDFDEKEAAKKESRLAVLQNYRFRFGNLSKDASKMIRKLADSEETARNITPSFIMNLCSSELIERKGFGRKCLDSLVALQKKLYNFLEGESKLERILVRKDYGQNMTLPEIDRSLLKDIQLFTVSLHGTDRQIFVKRSGFLGKTFTLEAIATELDITRERVRQIENRMMNDLKHTVRIRSEVLKSKLQDKTTSAITTKMNCLGKFFSDENLIKLLSFLSTTDLRSAASENKIRYSTDILDGLFLHEKAPITKRRCVDYIKDKLDIEKMYAEHIITELANLNLLSIDEHMISPRNAKKEIAIANLLSQHPEGLDWAEIARVVNHKNLCKATLSTKRTDYMMHSSKYIFQSGRRKFTHIQFLGLSENEVQSWLADMKARLKNSKYRAMHLLAEYYADTNDPKPDYYRIRCIARNFGRREGIYFYGKSQCDSISLYSDASVVPQKEALARVLMERSLTIEKVAERIKSQSENHAWMYLNELISEGKIVKKDDGTFASREIAFPVSQAAK